MAEKGLFQKPLRTAGRKSLNPHAHERTDGMVQNQMILMQCSLKGRLGAPMRCCEAYFEDNFLKDYIRRHGRRGTCQYCLARRKFASEAGELEPLFARFAAVYSPLNPGVNAPPDVDVLRVRTKHCRSARQSPA